MPTMGADFFGRLQDFMNTYGAGGLLVLIITALIVIGFILWRGIGLILLILFLSYAVGSLDYGGIIPLMTLVRWACLGLLIISFFKGFQSPRASMYLLFFYTFLGLLFIFRAEVLTWSLQRAVLLMMTVFLVFAGTSNYINSPEKVKRLFKMGIFAAAIWTAINMLFVREFMYSVRLTYAGGGEVGGGGVAWAGAFFSPMIVWGIMQKGSKFWRIFGSTLIVPFCFVLLMGSVRTAILGMLIIGSLPLLFLRIKPIRIIVTMFVFGILLTISVYLLFMLLPGKADFLIERIFSTSTTGRVERWLLALNLCIRETGFIGKGIGAADIAAHQAGMSFHNAYLTIWYNTGLLGLISVLIFLAIYIIRGFHLVCRRQPEDMKEFSRVSFGYILGLTAIGMFEDAFAGSAGVAVSMLVISATLIDRLDNMTKQESYLEFVSQHDVATENIDIFEEETSWDAPAFYGDGH